MVLSRFFAVPISQAPTHNLKDHQEIWPKGIFLGGKSRPRFGAPRAERTSSSEAAGEITEFAVAIDQTSPKRNHSRRLHYL
jgi:hypothetical protein